MVNAKRDLVPWNSIHHQLFSLCTLASRCLHIFTSNFHFATSSFSFSIFHSIIFLQSFGSLCCLFDSRNAFWVQKIETTLSNLLYAFLLWFPKTYCEKFKIIFWNCNEYEKPNALEKAIRSLFTNFMATIQPHFPLLSPFRMREILSVTKIRWTTFHLPFGHFSDHVVQIHH